MSALAIEKQGQFYVCVIDGLSYTSREAAVAHMRIQHSLQGSTRFVVKEIPYP